MPVTLKTRGLRWVVPGGVAATIALASFLASTVASASAEPNLPPRTAAQLLVSLEQARPAGLSGTIVETAKLGLPALPDIGGSGGDASLSLPNLVTGAHTLRVWYAGHQDQRLALLGQLSESDVIHHGTDLWTYTSTNRRVTHTTLPTNQADVNPAQHLGTLTPQQAAEDALNAIDPTTSVSVDRTARVAGRAAYQLVLSPKDTRSLIGSVRIAIDANTSVPLRVQVFARGASSPAIQVGFTDISFKVPDSSVFRFVPPAGSTVVQGNPLTDAGPGAPLRHRMVEKAPAGAKVHAPATAPKTAPTNGVPGADSGRTKVLGSGWTTVLEINSGAAADQANSPFGALLNKAATPVNGGRLLTSALFSVFIANDGRMFVGPVTGTAIQQVAATGHGL